MGDANFFLAAMLLLLLAASAFGWLRLLPRLLAGEPLIRPRNLPAAPWGLVDLIMVMGLITLLQFAVLYWLYMNHGIDLDAKLTEIPYDQALLRIAGIALAGLATPPLVFLAVKLRSGADAEQMGIDPFEFWGDLKLGLAGFVLLAGPVYGLQAALSYYFPSQHPLILLIQQHRDFRLYGWIVISAVVAAPLAEELIFRVVLQGWLQNLDRWGDPIHFLIGFPKNGKRRFASRQSYEAADAENPYASPAGKSYYADDPPASSPEQRREYSKHSGPSFWPILFSSLIFALAHYTHGPDPIPLVFLALGLGYLYQRTGRITASVVVHFLLNGVTMLALLVEMVSKR